MFEKAQVKLQIDARLHQVGQQKDVPHHVQLQDAVPGQFIQGARGDDVLMELRIVENSLCIGVSTYNLWALRCRKKVTWPKRRGDIFAASKARLMT